MDKIPKTDDELLSKLKQEILIYQYYKSKFEFYARKTRRSRSFKPFINFHKINKQTLASPIIENLEFEELSPVQLRSRGKHLTTIPMSSLETQTCKKNLDPQEIYGYIKECFMRLYINNISLGGAKIKKKTQTIHISNIKQFFLDFCIVSKNTIKQVLKPVKRKTWLSFCDFLQAVETLNSKLKLKIPLKSWKIETFIKKNIEVLLFFFKLLQTFDENDLELEEIKLIFKIAIKDLPVAIINSYVHLVILKKHQTRINFEEFLNHILAW